jgi:GTP cyclohydrolase I
MNVRDLHHQIPDIQSTPDTRKIAISRVGVKGVRYPLQIKTSTGTQATVGQWNMYVQLSETQKGTHMSRFIVLLEELNQQAPLDMPLFVGLLHKMTKLLDAKAGRIELTFPYFINKSAPISGVQSLMDYEISIAGEIKSSAANNHIETTIKLVIPVTSLCPCSKKISSYGAHNQRSHISISALISADLAIDELISEVEAQASSELYGLLKRPDEKYVTERAYDNPKFVEDLVRDVAGVLNADPRILAYTLEAENFESIHNHSAYAFIENDKRIKLTH